MKRVKRIGTVTAAAFMIGALLAGCAENQGDLGNRNIRPNSVREDANGNKVIDKRFANDQSNEMNRINGRRLNSNNLIGSHQNYRLEMSPDIAERISRLTGTGTAYVMLTDRNAYVAVATDNRKKRKSLSRTNLGHAGDGTEPGTGPHSMNAGGTGNAQDDKFSGSGGTGIDPSNTSKTGTAQRDGTDGIGRRISGPNITGSTVNPNGSSLSGLGGTYGTLDGPEAGGGMQSSRTGTRSDMGPGPGQIFTQNAADGTEIGIGTTEAGRDIPQALKNRIAQEVVRMAPGIENVYVSAKPDFTERMTSYAMDVRDGHPIQGFIAEFNAMADRIFPVNSGILSRTGRRMQGP
jgi:hypothetical protein